MVWNMDVEGCMIYMGFGKRNTRVNLETTGN